MVPDLDVECPLMESPYRVIAYTSWADAMEARPESRSAAGLQLCLLSLITSQFRESASPPAIG